MSHTVCYKSVFHNANQSVPYFALKTLRAPCISAVLKDVNTCARLSISVTEMSGPGVGGECEYQNGTHLWEDMFYPEIINPDTLEPVAPGEFALTERKDEGRLTVRRSTNWFYSTILNGIRVNKGR